MAIIGARRVVIIKIDIWNDEIERWCKFQPDVEHVADGTTGRVNAWLSTTSNYDWKRAIAGVSNIVLPHISIERNWILLFACGSSMVEIQSVMVCHEQFIGLATFTENSLPGTCLETKVLELLQIGFQSRV
jgi:hypothetical protein